MLISENYNTRMGEERNYISRDFIETGNWNCGQYVTSVVSCYSHFWSSDHYLPPSMPVSQPTAKCHPP